MLKRCIVLVMAVCTLSVVCFSTSKSPKKQDTNRLTSEGELRLMRTLGTAEADAEGSQGAFLPLDRLLSHRFFQRNRSEFMLMDSTSAEIKDYKLSVVVSADGKHFHAALTPKEGCGTALSTDEHYIIYEGRALGCESK
ncbi:MAG TPA: hypothetical protein VI756_17470 [Blastocatellia bacterium]